mmetsp:Transcript_19751/g.45375  ORF Transcript_19751/g.45375 Transcript_19751/m.45375 type:complete len:146 (-) Transcript_19751:169-606(-)
MTGFGCLQTPRRWPFHGGQEAMLARSSEQREGEVVELGVLLCDEVWLQHLGHAWELLPQDLFPLGRQLDRAFPPSAPSASRGRNSYHRFACTLAGSVRGATRSLCVLLYCTAKRASDSPPSVGREDAELTHVIRESLLEADVLAA